MRKIFRLEPILVISTEHTGTIRKVEYKVKNTLEIMNYYIEVREENIGTTGNERI